MQDMATMQQALVTSPSPATAQESSSVTTGGAAEMQQETSRTDAEICEDSGTKAQSTRHPDMDNEQPYKNNEVCEEEKMMDGEEEAVEEEEEEEDEEEEEEEEESSTAPDDGGRSFTCPICAEALESQHDFTLHIRSHNNDCGGGEEAAVVGAAVNGGGFVCRVCGKALSSGSSLDRHVLVHSGERPFRCRVCGVSFTTNGNMHRHMRTHAEDGACPLEAKRRRLGSPPPEPDRRHALDLSLDAEDSSSSSRPQAQRLQCPVCCRVDFVSLNVLETHLEEAHPEHKARCHLCDLVFKNHRALNLHRSMKHFGEERDKAASVIGFRDLTFVDFSSEKFPMIAKTVCEQSLHRASSTFHRFQCERCARAFPCGKALAIHRHSCDDGVGGPRVVDDERRQDNFLARLELQTKSASLSPPPDYPRSEDRFEGDAYFTGGRDLADIQSILSLTSAGGLLQELCASPRPRSDITPPDSAAKSSDSGNGADDEQQDCFAAEFRRMKLKGEFPCRLCIAVFPNLRALKGHNRVHLSASGGLHRCNMCPFANPDKAVVVRHMRTHNGDRPYECALCNYAFTTKANCERHLRNRHSKLSRDEVKNSIIYHPSEDPSNDPDGQVKVLSAREDVKRTLVFGGHTEDGSSSDLQEQQDALKPEEENSRQTNFMPKRIPPAQNRSWETHEVATMTHFADDEEMQESDDNQTVPDDRVLVNLTKNNSIIKNALMFKRNPENQRLYMKEQVRTSTSCAQFMKKCVDYEKYNDGNEGDDDMLEGEEVDDDDDDDNDDDNDDDDDESNIPLDLSMDALDLSKKKPVPLVTKQLNETQPQDLSKKSQTHNVDISKKTLLQSAFIPTHKSAINPNISPAAVSPGVYKRSVSPGSHGTGPVPKVELKGGGLYPGHALYLNNNGYFPAQPLFQVPYLMSPHNHNLFTGSNMKDLAEMKERLQKELIRGLQLTSGGTLLDPMAMANRVHILHGRAEMCARPKPDIKMDYADSKVKIECAGNSGLSPSIDSKEGIVNNVSLTPPNLTASPKPVLREKDASASVKMVIKNGVLMPKQKQRRYRTERPFSCEFCSARFTLRSNMERHIKQQHPQCWSQRQRNGNALTRRGHSTSMPHSQDSRSSLDSLGHVDLNVPSVDDEKQAKVEEALKTASEGEVKQVKETLPDSAINKNIGNSNKPYISEEVKLAIAQQLKSKLNPSSAGAVVKTEEEEEDGDGLVIDEEKEAVLEEDADQQRLGKEDGVVDLASVSRLLDNATTQNRAFQQYFQGTQDGEDEGRGDGSEEDEEGLVAGSNSEGNNSGSDENRSESEAHSNGSSVKKKSAYSLAPNRVSCPYCNRKFPWSSSLRRHVLTHTGQKPFKCPHCPLLFTTKSNCDRHLLRKHAGHGSVTGTGNPAHPAPANTGTTAVSSNNSSCGEVSPPAANGYTMRNVPDRPYKCNFCPSSTFSTESNLRKHRATKHGCGTSNGPLSPGAIARDCSGNESHCLAAEDSNSEDADEHELETSATRNASLPPEGESCPQSELKSPLPVLDVAVPKTVSAFDNHSSGMSTSSSVSSSDLPFKCHLCEGSYAERQEALDHIRDHHPPEFELLMSKGALEAMSNDDSTQQQASVHDEGTVGDENLEQLRGKFPDYANRKVMCAFCLRRFWSAEDLRRHMRTHTGERPFSCDICRRRFTLKHSMLRHRKKHSPPCAQLADDISMVSGDEEGGHAGVVVNVPRPPLPLNAPVGAEKLKSQLKLINHNNNNIAPSNGLSSSFGWDAGKVDFTISAAHILSSKFAGDKRDEALEADTGLIEKMLDIQDKSIIEKVLLSKSPEDAAKLLGMKNGGHE